LAATTLYKFPTIDPPPRIRLARLEEASALSELCVRSKAAWGYGEAFIALARIALEVRPEQVAAGDVWVATGSDGEVAGLVALAPSEQPNTLDLDKLFVEPQRIRNGVGRVLITHAIDEARRRGAERLTILADPYAAGFYERNGARWIGEAPSDAIPGRSLPLYEIKLD
jgi:GNAT superfamily N-acetyltransferase